MRLPCSTTTPHLASRAATRSSQSSQWPRPGPYLAPLHLQHRYFAHRQPCPSPLLSSRELSIRVATALPQSSAWSRVFRDTCKYQLITTQFASPSALFCALLSLLTLPSLSTFCTHAILCPAASSVRSVSPNPMPYPRETRAFLGRSPVSTSKQTFRATTPQTASPIYKGKPTHSSPQDPFALFPGTVRKSGGTCRLRHARFKPHSIALRQPHRAACKTQLNSHTSDPRAVSRKRTRQTRADSPATRPAFGGAGN
ncbi:hypothetical protein EJ04DRAFT_112982 [Polyplosphaeria fusca]|uniref:Uncharacterized protein n=1 Tax=Polyplosphaeria fusca TaxID=682080 RepID=A0A9P4RDC3_9PLEO|nr:hypothetical protein EJ04DRAFT_112982 [Polyplosphaeria fusca]